MDNYYIIISIDTDNISFLLDNFTITFLDHFNDVSPVIVIR